MSIFIKFEDLNDFNIKKTIIGKKFGKNFLCSICLEISLKIIK